MIVRVAGSVSIQAGEPAISREIGVRTVVYEPGDKGLRRRCGRGRIRIFVKKGGILLTYHDPRGYPRDRPEVEACGPSRVS
ncbi:MAG: hypothetical protein OXF02_00275 [Simkaniaceae bacterium]|nr:hypothetical protein [Simkaniaceae bacterium]